MRNLSYLRRRSAFQNAPSCIEKIKSPRIWPPSCQSITVAERSTLSSFYFTILYRSTTVLVLLYCSLLQFSSARAHFGLELSPKFRSEVNRETRRGVRAPGFLQERGRDGDRSAPQGTFLSLSTPLSLSSFFRSFIHLIRDRGFFISQSSLECRLMAYLYYDFLSLSVFIFFPEYLCFISYC